MTANPEHGFSNLAYSATSAAISSTDTQIPLVASGAATFLDGWLSGRNVYLTLTNASGDIEVVKVTGIYHDILTVERGQDGTTAQAWGVGALVCQRGPATDVTSFIQKGASRTYAGNPNGVLAGLYPGEKVYDSDSRGWWINITGTLWKCITGTCASLWLDYFDNTYWNATLNGKWSGTAWQALDMAHWTLEPIGTWATGFYPSKMRITTFYAGGFKVYNVADPAHLLYSNFPYVPDTGSPYTHQYEFFLDWSYDPVTPISKLDLYDISLVTSIEFWL